MTRRARLLLAAFIALAPLSHLAAAQAQPRLETQISTQTVEVGQTLRVQLSATGAEQADSPRLEVPQGFVVDGPSVGTSQQVSIVNGSVSRTVGLTATWQLTATKVGEFTVGPASVNSSQGRVSGQRVRVRVVPPGQGPQAPRRSPRSPFDLDPFPGLGRTGRSLFDDVFGIGDPQTQPQAPAEYQIESAPDDIAFLRASVDKKRVVVGEQVTLKIYGYGGRGRFNENDPSEPRRPNFYSFPIVERSGREPLYVTTVGERVFHVAKLRELALFPLKAGRQEIGPMTIKFYGSGYVTRLSPEGLERKSPVVSVEVVDPPVQGRPNGYRIGDVGNYRLEVVVAPNAIEAGGSVSVTATLKGIGNLPTQLLTPDQHGVEWLTPSITDHVQVLKDGRVGGSRTFTYVVRLTKVGRVSLGELTLPFYNPAAAQYSVARAALGQIEVKPSSRPAAEQTKEREKLSALAKVHPSQGQYNATTTHIADQPWYWFLIAGSPLSVLMVQAGQSLVQRVRKRRRGATDSLEKKSKAALDAAAAAARKDDAEAAIAHIERALFLGIEASCGLRARALLKEQLGEALTAAGLAEDQAGALEALLRDTESLRFGGANLSLSELLQRASKLLKSLPARARKAVH